MWDVDADARALRASLGEPERFGEIFDRHHGLIWTYLARIGGAQAADDLTGEVFASAFEARHRYDPARGSVRSWLYGIATNHSRTRFRSLARAQRATERLDRTGPPLDGTEVIDDADELRLAAAQVRQALAEVSVDDCQLIVLAAWEELSYGEMAEVLGVPVGTVRSRLSRARARLRQQVEAGHRRPVVAPGDDTEPIGRGGRI